jgi:hypothetical protein
VNGVRVGKGKFVHINAKDRILLGSDSRVGFEVEISDS